jgi:nitrate reductase NapE component
MKYEEEVFSKESVKARRDNKLNTRSTNFKKGIEKNKQKRKEEFKTFLLIAVPYITIITLAIINICGL